MNVPSLFGKEVVAYTPEIDRIARLPRRVWSEQEGLDLASDMTRELKTPRGTMSLRPVQAIGLYEAMQMKGMFGPQRVGAGKTLETLLLALVLQALRPVLLLPAGLIEKTVNIDRRALAEHWQLPTNLQLVSYEMLGLVQSIQRLDYISPDLIIADECHYLKSPRAGRTKRVRRYMNENPRTMFCALSGTIMKASIIDFAPLLRWALKENAPIPSTVDETATWSEALDEKINPLQRRRPGALQNLASPPRVVMTLPAARQVFQERLLETRGVIASSKTDGVTCSLVINALEYKASALTEAHVQHLRGTWTTPDGWPFIEALALRRYLRELAMGFHGVWDPRPPPEWLAARKAWASWAREILSHSKTLDTELQVIHAVDGKPIEGPNGWWKPKKLDDGGLLDRWRAVKDIFQIQPKPIWHDDSALNAAAKWMESEKGIVWTEHTFFAKKLAEMTGCSYFGAEGLNDKGENIVLVKPGRAIIASIAANSTGKNLQMFSKNLLTSCPPGSATLEQTIGRTHRDGQEEDEVTVDILLGCADHFDAFNRALEGARAAADTLGHDQKLLLATIAFPVSIAERQGPMWA